MGVKDKSQMVMRISLLIHTRSHYYNPACLELPAILLPLPPEHWILRLQAVLSLSLAYVVFVNKYIHVYMLYTVKQILPVLLGEQ